MNLIRFTLCKVQTRGLRLKEEVGEEEIMVGLVLAF